MTNTIKTGRLISHRPDRFGARLTSLVNTKRIADKLGIEYGVYWQRTTDFGSVFNDPTELFADSFVEKYFIGRKEWKSTRGPTRTEGPLGKHTGQSLVDVVQSGGDVPVGVAFGIVALADENRAIVKQEFVQAFHDIPLPPDLQEIFDRVKPLLQGATAYHIRRGDLLDGMLAKNRNWSHKFVPTKFYEFHIRKTLETDAKIVLFSDEPETIAQYKEKFPQVQSLSDILGEINVSAGAYDFLELFAMSCCNEIIAPSQSAFSGAAKILGNAKLISLLDDLDATNRDRMFDDLISWLNAPPEPDYIAGEIGQCLAHATEYYIERNQLKKAADLMKLWIDRGLNISHIYATTGNIFIKLKDFKSIVELSDRAKQGYVYFPKDKVILDFETSFANMKLDNLEEAVSAAQTGFWTAPWHSAQIPVIGAMLAKGMLNDSNFFPVDMELLALGPESEFDVDDKSIIKRRYPRILQSQSEEEFVKVKSLLPIIWDWAFLLPEHGDREEQDVRPFLKQIAKLRNDGIDAPWMRSFEAASQAEFGDIEQAIAKLKEIFDETQDALTAFRCSQAYLKSGQPKEAIQWARLATETSTAPAYQAWLAKCLMQSTRYKAAKAPIDAALSELPGIASVPALKAKLLVRLGEKDAAIAAYKDLEKIAPLNPIFRRQQADLFWETGDRDAALNALSDVADGLLLAPVGYLTYVKYLLQTDNTERAQLILATARHRYPDSRRLKKFNIDSGKDAKVIVAFDVLSRALSRVKS